MSDGTPLFRSEAVEYQASQRGPGEPLQLPAGRWASWAYWVLLAALAMGLLATLAVRVDGERLLFVLVPAFRDWWHRLHG